MDQSIFKIGGWKHSATQQSKKLSEECVEENELWLLSIRIPNRDSFFMIQYMERPFVCDNSNVKESKPLCEDLHEMIQWYGRQHFAAGYRILGKWKMRSESSECTWKTQVILIHLENYFEERAQKVWERRLMNPDVHTVVGHEHSEADGDDSDGTS